MKAKEPQTSADLRPWLHRHPGGIFLVDPRHPGYVPRRVTLDGVQLERFLDYILVPGPLEELTTDQVCVVNALRLRLLAGGFLSDVHSLVKDVFASAIRLLHPRIVVEWGCGFDALNLRLPTSTKYACTDIDPEVVKFQREMGVDAYLPQDAHLVSQYGQSSDLIASVFVFHFEISRADALTMRDLLTPDGMIFANVYRRSVVSRARLVAMFEQVGFRVARRPDPQKLCSDHEYWLLSREADTLALETRLLELLAQVR